jgi:hypothetical protein
VRGRKWLPPLYPTPPTFAIPQANTRETDECNAEEHSHNGVHYENSTEPLFTFGDNPAPKWIGESTKEEPDPPEPPTGLTTQTAKRTTSSEIYMKFYPIHAEATYMLTIYRRHLKRCDHRSEGRKYRRCPIWVDGFLRREEIRKSLETTDWEKAQGIIREWEVQGSQAPEPEAVTITQAWDDFLTDARARNLREPTIYSTTYSRARCAVRRGPGIAVST